MSLTFSGTATAGDNLGNVTNFVGALLDATMLPGGSKLIIGMGLAGAGVGLDGGALYAFNGNRTLCSRLATAASEGVSYVMPLGNTPNTTVTALCGLTTARFGCEVLVDRTFRGTCSNVTRDDELFELPSAVGPVNPSSVDPESALGVEGRLGAGVGLVTLLVSLTLEAL